MQQASYLDVALYLHVNKKSDYDDMMMMTKLQKKNLTIEITYVRPIFGCKFNIWVNIREKTQKQKRQMVSD